MYKFSKLRIIVAGVLIACLPGILRAQSPELKAELAKIVDAAEGEIGVGVYDFRSGQTIVLNEKHQFPMQSVFKFPLAMVVLEQVDRGKLKLDQKVYVSKVDLLPTYSPLREKFPNGNIYVTVEELLTYSASLSDNNACDILFRLVGGTKVANQYIHALGVKDIAIVANEVEMSKGWDVQFRNFSTPEGMLHLLRIFQDGKQLSAKSTAFLMKIMTDTPTGAKRLKGKLDSSAMVTHKTGTSGKNDKGITAATNDVGILTFPDGRKVAVVVFVSNSPASEASREMVIADIGQAVWNRYFTK